MMDESGSLRQVADLIRLSVAPIFLLTAVAGTLNLFAGRLARIVDRGRGLEKSAGDQAATELRLVARRARLIYRALFLGVSAAVLVSALMTLAFAGAIFGFDATRAIALFFLLALFAYTGALLLVLREVFLALGGFNLGRR